MKRYAKVDANHALIVAALRGAGCAVQSMAAIGKGAPDLLVSYQRGGEKHTLCMEIKDGNKPPSARKLTPDQERWHRQWKGRLVVVTSLAEALAAIGVETNGS